MPKATILIVEDEQIVALDLWRSLENCGYQVVGQADRGEDALQKAAALRPDLVLMDIGLKGEVDGIEAATQLRTRLQLPVIFLTAFADEATVRRARPAEPYGYILKPFDERGLASNIEMALYKHTVDKKLRESEARFRGVIEHSADGMVLADHHGKLIEWNPAAEQLTGLERSQVLGQSLLDVMLHLIPAESRTPGLQAALANQWNPVVKNEPARRPDQMAEFEIETPQGERRVIQTHGFSVESAEGTLVGASLRDTTGRMRADEALRESEERFRGLFEYSPISLWEEDFSTVKAWMDDLRQTGVIDFEAYFTSHPEAVDECLRRMTVLDVNQATVKLYGAQSKHELLNNIGHAFGPEVRRVGIEELVAIARGEREFESVGVNHKLTGERMDVSLRWFIPSDHEQTLARVIVSVDDITARVRSEQAQQHAEQALRQERALLAQRVAARTAELSARTAELQQTNAELLRANRLKDEFLANMSHELRTPLTAVLGLSETLQMGTYGPISDKQAQILQVIRQSGQHLLELITEILDLSRIEAGKMELLLAPTAAADICEASLHFIQQPAQKKNIRVMFTPDPQVRLLQADARRLKQMLVNLLSNAVKFTPEGGQVGLEMTGDPTRHEVHFSVWDTGIGIPPEKQALLFQPFVQVDGSLARRFEGAGLGLALTRRLAEMHGGRVTVASEGTDKGSRFTLILPWQAVETPHPLQCPLAVPEEPAPEVVAWPMDHTPVILVAEDNEATRMALSDFLETLPASVVTARDGQEALTQAQATHPDLIVMDIQMPGLDGLEAIRRLKAAPQTAQTPIIALTALTMPGDREQCLAAGANDYLSKPVSLKQIVTIIEKYVSQPLR